jgi:hypothetical protein
LPINSGRIVKLGADDMEATKVFNTIAQFNVGASASHVG